MKFYERGLSIVEIVMVLVALTILASTAIPSFVDNQSPATAVDVEGIASSLGSASAINYAVRSLTSGNGRAVANCQDVARTLEGTLPWGFTIADTPIAPGVKQKCTVTHSNGQSAVFVGHGIS